MSPGFPFRGALLEIPRERNISEHVFLGTEGRGWYRGDQSGVASTKMDFEQGGEISSNKKGRGEITGKFISTK